MNAIKNAMVVVLLLGVGYGAHIVLNRSLIDETNLDDASISLPDSLVDMNNAHAGRPDIQLEAPTVGMPDDAMSTGTNLPSMDPFAPQNQATHDTDDQGPNGQFNSDKPTAIESKIEESPQAETAPSKIALDTGEGPSTYSPPKTRDDSLAGDPEQAPNLDTTWQSVKESLAQDDLVNALFTLSLASAEPGITDQQREELLPLMDQLAGTVIYSRQHLMEPPYTVVGNESLEDIATKYQVPASLLAKINGIEAPYTLTPGETLKVITGPFRAVVDLSKAELNVYLGRYYGGRFPLHLGSNVPPADVALTVIEKVDQQEYADAASGQTIPPGDANNPYGSHWIGLGERSGENVAQWAIHGCGESCPEDDQRGILGLRPRDAEDVYAILAIGSTVHVIR